MILRVGSIAGAGCSAVTSAITGVMLGVVVVLVVVITSILGVVHVAVNVGLVLVVVDNEMPTTSTTVFVTQEFVDVSWFVGWLACLFVC